MGLVAIENDDEEGNDADEHVSDGEDAVNAGSGVQVREVIDSGDEGIPWEKVAEAEGEVDDVGKVALVLGNLVGCGFVSCGGTKEARGRHANQTEKIYLNPSEQENCLASIKVFEKNISGCGVAKLTSGAGGCSEYSVMDVMDKLGDQLRRLDEDCMALSIDGRTNETCSACLRRWEEISATSDNKRDSESANNIDANLCRFAVLISLTSITSYDRESIQAVYECLSTYSLSAVTNKQGGKDSGNSKIHPGLWVLSFGLAGITMIVLLAAWTLYRKRNGSPPKEQGETEDSTSLKITIKEVYMATNNFSPSNFIGEGVAGKVYKGILSNGQHVAIKRIMNEGQLETFVREVRSLSHVRHPNLVSLVGYCESEGECFLVAVMIGKDKVLSWIQRLKIAVDSAKGLVFLHTYPAGCIIHRDIKPSNILIGTNLQAKLSDFGLSKFMDVGQSFVSSEVRGTLGYIDPEYRRNHHVKASGDVYSFGIVLLQLLSGQRVININFQRPMSLNKMVRSMLLLQNIEAINFARGGDVSEFVDSKLKGDYSEEAFSITLKLALLCIGIKQQRPSMEQVLPLKRSPNIATRPFFLPLSEPSLIRLIKLEIASGSSPINFLFFSSEARMTSLVDVTITILLTHIRNGNAVLRTILMNQGTKRQIRYQFDAAKAFPCLGANRISTVEPFENRRAINQKERRPEPWQRIWTRCENGWRSDPTPSASIVYSLRECSLEAGTGAFGRKGIEGDTRQRRIRWHPSFEGRIVRRLFGSEERVTRGAIIMERTRDIEDAIASLAFMLDDGLCLFPNPPTEAVPVLQSDLLGDGVVRAVAV
ncbi:putative LRR receptor-like serine/threonine-protein kinase [Senna tora]|uniref:Putative LRR receptor-like serine/threonine-protein kinase n=1 Tax=Senna tora TaxID=362788 RepID=A0A834WQ68_9FABA|nr:putative LRR receptor-like serine/threonine-protein kinase [Senna tora]